MNPGLMTAGPADTKGGSMQTQTAGGHERYLTVTQTARELRVGRPLLLRVRESSGIGPDVVAGTVKLYGPGAVAALRAELCRLYPDYASGRPLRPGRPRKRPA
jgi:hypothetical protein